MDIYLQQGGSNMKKPPVGALGPGEELSAAPAAQWRNAFTAESLKVSITPEKESLDFH